MRRINRATVLQIVRDRRTTSRIDIAQLSGLNKATVSYIVDELIRDAWVQEIGYGSSSGGRKPILLRFNANAVHAIGVDVRLSSIKTVICNARGEIVYNRERAVPDLPAQDPRDKLLEAILSEVGLAMASAPSSPHGLAGLGLAFPGAVDFQTGLVHYFPGLSIAGWDVRSAVAGRVKLPVFCDSDANCGAWCELQLRNFAHKNLVYIHVGASIGVGVIIGGELYRGRDGLAGEFGHMTIMPMGQRCLCGSYGCWEEYASERSLPRHIADAGGDAGDFVADHDLVRRLLNEAQSDNRTVIRAFHSLGQYLGIGIANIVNALNPEYISMGGTLARAATFILPEIERALGQRAISLNKKTPVAIANVHSVAIGAAGLATDHVLFQNPLYGS